ncbi:MAG: DUF2937 family protein [Porticoccaceae bacterium]|nr:DUF2937 family protein [Porticoccaceae bacterium]
MHPISDYLRLLFFTSGLLIGVQVPAFIDQYGKSLEAHLLESTAALREFEKDAERYFDGDLAQLIAHYQKHGDPVIRDGGNSINAIYIRNQVLAQAWKSFTTSSYSAYTHVLLAPLTEIKKEVWRSYTYSIILNPSAIISGLTGGLILSLLIDICGMLVTAGMRRLLQPHQ